MISQASPGRAGTLRGTLPERVRRLMLRPDGSPRPPARRVARRRHSISSAPCAPVAARASLTGGGDSLDNRPTTRTRFAGARANATLTLLSNRARGTDQQPQTGAKMGTARAHAAPRSSSAAKARRRLPAKPGGGTSGFVTGASIGATTTMLSLLAPTKPSRAWAEQDHGVAASATVSLAELASCALPGHGGGDSPGQGGIPADPVPSPWPLISVASATCSDDEASAQRSPAARGPRSWPLPQTESASSRGASARSRHMGRVAHPPEPAMVVTRHEATGSSAGRPALVALPSLPRVRPSDIAAADALATARGIKAAEAARGRASDRASLTGDETSSPLAEPSPPLAGLDVNDLSLLGAVPQLRQHWLEHRAWEARRLERAATKARDEISRSLGLKAAAFTAQRRRERRERGGMAREDLHSRFAEWWVQDAVSARAAGRLAGERRAMASEDSRGQARRVAEAAAAAACVLDARLAGMERAIMAAEEERSLLAGQHARWEERQRTIAAGAMQLAEAETAAADAAGCLVGTAAAIARPMALPSRALVPAREGLLARSRGTVSPLRRAGDRMRRFRPSRQQGNGRSPEDLIRHPYLRQIDLVWARSVLREAVASAALWRRELAAVRRRAAGTVRSAVTAAVVTSRLRRRLAAGRRLAAFAAWELRRRLTARRRIVAFVLRGARRRHLARRRLAGFVRTALRLRLAARGRIASFVGESMDRRRTARRQIAEFVCRQRLRAARARQAALAREVAAAAAAAERQRAGRVLVRALRRQVLRREQLRQGAASSLAAFLLLDVTGSGVLRLCDAAEAFRAWAAQSGVPEGTEVEPCRVERLFGEGRGADRTVTEAEWTETAIARAGPAVRVWLCALAEEHGRRAVVAARRMSEPARSRRLAVTSSGRVGTSQRLALTAHMAPAGE